MSRRALRTLVYSAALTALGAALVPGAAWSQPAAPAASAAPAGSGSAAPASSAALPPAAASTSPAPAASVPTIKLKKGAPPPPPPTAKQLKALGILKQEAAEYEQGAKSFRDTLTMIVRHHYEERRRRILSALDREISIEKKGLVDARNEAIKRLEKFIALYSGENAHPSATPDAMFRLAALYEERARESQDSDIASGLEPAIALYRRIITEYPNYEEIAAVHYFLGHAYTDSAKLDQGQQAWRSLVCANHYQVKPDPQDADKIELQPLPQDHDDKFWTEWYNKNPVPLDQAGGKRKPGAQAQGHLRRDPALRHGRGGADLQGSVSSGLQAVAPGPAAGGGAPLSRRGLVAARQLPLRPDRSARRPLQPEPRCQRLRSLARVQEAAAVRRRDVQAGVDVLQAAALPHRGGVVRQAAPLR